MYRVIKSSTKVQASRSLDVSWLNGFKEIPFQDADLLSDSEKKEIINNILRRVQLSNQDWANIENWGGVYIENFQMSPARYGNTDVYQGAFDETYAYDISCDVIIPGKTEDTVVPVQYTHQKTYRRNMYS